MIWSRREAGLLRQLRRLQRREHHAGVQDLLGREPEVPVRVVLHLLHDELLVERAAIDADAHRLAVVPCHLADGRELLITPASCADVAGIDAVLVERRGTGGVAGQQEVPVVVEVADERHRAAGVEHPLLDLGHRGRGFGQVDGDPDHLGPGLGELDYLLRGRACVGCVGHGHRLDDHGRTAPDLEAPDLDPNRPVKSRGLHGRYTCTTVRMER